MEDGNDSKAVIGNITFDVITMEELFASLKNDLEEDKKITISFANPEFVLEAQKNRNLSLYLNECKYVLADGVGIIWAARILNRGILPERITGSDFVPRLASFCAHNNYTLFLLGGAPGIANKAENRLLQMEPELNVVGTHHGYFNDSSEIIHKINMLKPDVLMVCLGNPKQEEWISNNLNNINSKLIFGNGGALDFLSLNKKRAPKWMQDRGLEWLFRLIQDFRVDRIRRQIGLIKYVMLVIFRII